MNLSIEKKIPYLFGNNEGRDDFYEDTHYWTSYGYVTINNGNKTFEIKEDETGTHPVRCVYDEWYWKDKTENLTTFTWGDAPMGDPQNPDNSTNP